MPDSVPVAKADLPPSSGSSVTREPYPHYAIALLVVVYVLHNLDRQIINILAEPIKQELNLKDWQIGMMTGLAFSVFYAGLGIPIARLSERGNRSVIIATSIVVWSGFTAVCGLAQNFLQIILARIGVGVGEAGCTPAAHSLISDIVPRERRASALGTYAMGAPFGALLGLAMGGLVFDAYGWRMGFFVAAAPGILVGALVLLTLREPRAEMTATARAAQPRQTFRDAMKELRGIRSFWLVAIGSAFQAVVAYGHGAFLASFFFRIHGSDLTRIAGGFGLETAGFLGLAIGLISGVSGLTGAFIGGKLADRSIARNPRGLATQIAICNLIAVPVYIAAMSVASAPLALALLVIPSLCYGMTYGPMFTVFQSVVQPHTRATATSIYLLITNLVGLGVGPLLVGIMSDYFAGGMGMGEGEGLRWAQIGSTFLGLVAAALYWNARPTMERDTVS